MFNQNFLSILLTNIVLGIPMPMLLLLGALAGTSLASKPALGTLTLSVQMIAGIVTAGPLSRYMARVGRQRGFMGVAAAMFLGGTLAVASLMLHSFWLLCIAHFLMGAALIGVNFLRFAASEAVSEQHKANAIAYTLASGLVAAMVGPTVFDLTRDVLPMAYSGAYASIAGLAALGVLPLLALKLPSSGNDGSAPGPVTATSASGDKEISTTLLDDRETGAPTGFINTLHSRPGIAIAIVSAVVAQAIMILMMVPTPLAMLSEGFTQAQAADVIRWHVIAMFAPGLITGNLIRRFGSIKVILAGLALLFIALVVAMISVSQSAFYLSLICLGVGWNFGFIGGTQLLQSELASHEKGRFQGTNETLVALASAVASLASGVLFQAFGWTWTLIAAMPLLLITLLILVRQIHQYNPASSEGVRPRVS